MRHADLNTLAPADLLTLNAKDVLNLMVAHSGRTWEDVAAVVGWSPTVLSRISCATDDYFPKLTSVPKFCTACKSTLILEWMAAQVDHGSVRLRPRGMNAGDLIASMGDLLGDLSATAQAATEAIGDERIDEAEARAMIRKLRDLSSTAARMIAGLRPNAGTVED